MISKSHPVANFLKVTGNIYTTKLQRVKEDSQARSKKIHLSQVLHLKQIIGFGMNSYHNSVMMMSFKMNIDY